MDLNSATQQLKANERFFNKAVGKAEFAFRRGDLNSVVAWTQIAAHFAFVRHPGFYTSPKLENLLLNVSRRIRPTQKLLKSIPQIDINNNGKIRFLHIITETYASGGHSPFIARWINNTNRESIHSLVATSYKGQLPEILDSRIRESGGWYISLPSLSRNLLERALILRQLTQNWADIVVLFIHPFDPLPIVSFGVKGGPPIIFSNHADHVFWLGVSIADVVADYHSSGSMLCAKRRGIKGSKILPIPLLKNGCSYTDSLSRDKLGLKKDEVILVTVGRDEKFFPFRGYDFLETMIKILKKHPKAKLFAVGPSQQGRWEKASEAVNGRISALGTIDRPLLRTYYEAADLYVTSFPCGSGTAMLEAGMYGIPIVGLHVKELPHVSEGDDVAFKKASVHFSSVPEFIQALESRIRDCYAYRQKAFPIKENIEREHCSPGWNTYLNELLQSLPSQHNVRKPRAVNSPTDYSDIYLAYLGSQMLCNELIEHTFCRLIRVYSKYLHKGEILKEQTTSLLYALPKVNSLFKGKEYLYNFREFLRSAEILI